MNKKTIITVTGIRPDFIRMSNIFKLLDEHFNHILIHTGQHYSNTLSGIFFEELEIRKPDYNLEIGGPGKTHYHQNSELTVKLIDLIKDNNLQPLLILFLGDSNSVACAVSLKKEGHIIGHIEAGMRSGDKRMLEEINRTVCDHCTDYHFVYHDDYKNNLLKENLPAENIFVTGNTIVDVCSPYTPDLFKVIKRNDSILVDIHRPENFKYKDRLANIIDYANTCGKLFNLPVRMLKFARTVSYIEEYSIQLGSIEMIDLMSYKKHLEAQYHSKFIISDSGTGQEEPALLNTPVIVPRDYTERPQSVDSQCSFMLDVGTFTNDTWAQSISWLNSSPAINIQWLGKGDTAKTIVDILRSIIYN